MDAIDEELRRLGPPLPADQAGERVDAYLSRNYPFFSRSAWQQRIEDGRLLVNGRPIKASARLRPGDQFFQLAPVAAEPEVERGIRPLWRDGAVMAVYKPGNLPMHENGPYRKNTFARLVIDELGAEWSAVHRLDRETSGIVLVGATPEARAKLCIDLAARRCKKEYLAIVRGLPAEDHWRCEGPIGDLRESLIRIKKWVVPDGLPAETHFSVEGRGREASLLRARPVTGRTNQIRIHAAHAGHELFGDKTYHPNEQVFLEYFENGQTTWVTEVTGHPRLCLHAAVMEFTHPETGRRERVECPMPDDMQALWSQRADSVCR